MDEIELVAGQTVLSVMPAIGGSIASLRFRGQNILAPTGRIPGFESNVAGTVLMPFSNRIGSCAFAWEGRSLLVPRNVDDEPFPLHGDGWQRSWEIVCREVDQMRLRLDNGEIGPFRYQAEQEYRIEPSRMHWSLSIRNLSGRRLPFGFGFHPWFPRKPQTKLEFSSERVWLNDSQHLPNRNVAIDAVLDWDFRTRSPLPKGFINNAFVGWDGAAWLSHGKRASPVRLTSSPNLSTVIIYSPDQNADFICFEPVSHPINAHNLPGMPGLTSLDAGGEVSAWLELNWLD